jgi:hypothetical protein
VREGSAVLIEFGRPDNVLTLCGHHYHELADAIADAGGVLVSLPD